MTRRKRLRDMGLKRSFFLLAALCLTASMLLAGAVWMACRTLSQQYPRGGIAIAPDGTVTELAEPTEEQIRMMQILTGVQLAAAAGLPAGGLALAGVLFYYWKLKPPIQVLRTGAARIQRQDLDFTIPEVSGDELGQVCAAFETMRKSLLETNQALWRQAEERRRLNAAFAHDLRNPLTVLKGTVKLLQRDGGNPQTLARLEAYTLRIAAYVEVMSGIQALEQMPVTPVPAGLSRLVRELEETGKLLAPGLALVWEAAPEDMPVELDQGLFLTAAENLIGNAARFARTRLALSLTLEDCRLTLTVADDGPGFPEALLRTGPQPFGKRDPEHFGMGLYTARLICRKHGGDLRLENASGARAAASFEIFLKP